MEGLSLGVHEATGLMPTVVVEGLHKAYGPVTAVDGLDLTIAF